MRAKDRLEQRQKPRDRETAEKRDKDRHSGTERLLKRETKTGILGQGESGAPHGRPRNPTPATSSNVHMSGVSPGAAKVLSTSQTSNLIFPSSTIILKPQQPLIKAKQTNKQTNKQINTNNRIGS